MVGAAAAGRITAVVVVAAAADIALATEIKYRSGFKVQRFRVEAQSEPLLVDKPDQLRVPVGRFSESSTGVPLIAPACLQRGNHDPAGQAEANPDSVSRVAVET